MALPSPRFTRIGCITRNPLHIDVVSSFAATAIRWLSGSWNNIRDGNQIVAVSDNGTSLDILNEVLIN